MKVALMPNRYIRKGLVSGFKLQRQKSGVWVAINLGFRQVYFPGRCFEGGKYAGSFF